MEDGYGVGITNRYDFLIDTDAIDPEVILKQKAKKAKKAAKKSAGKENSENGAKVDQQPGKLNDDKKVKFVVPGKGGKQLQQQYQQEPPQNGRSMKDTQNIQGNGNTENRYRENGYKENGYKENGYKENGFKENGYKENGFKDNGFRDNRNNFDRDRNNRNNENRQQRNYNRRNNDGGSDRPYQENGFRPPSRGNQTNPEYVNNENSNNYQEAEYNQQYNNQRDDRPARRQGNDRDFGHRRSDYQYQPRNNYDGQSRNYDGRGGRREFDRKSGSDKTGVKAVEKREGRGAHNWGDHKQDVEDLNIKHNSEAELKDDGGNSVGNAKSEENLSAPVEEVVLTLDEYYMQQLPRTLPVFNIRKAGEGEDKKKWKDFVRLPQKEGHKSEDEYGLIDMSKYPQRKRSIHVVNVEVYFNGGKRPGFNNNRRRRSFPPRSDDDGRKNYQGRQYAPQIDDRNFPSLG